MQCEDNSKLRTPLSEVCQTTDIGCVPITDGKPTCSPQPDELPFAFDPKTTTLWIFSCKNHEWINFTKFTMCQLDALNLDNITNICDILNIGVNYSGTGECKQGTITLAELVERIKECLKLETKIITIGEGDGNKIKISIEGLPNLPPVYVQGENIWSEGGSGTETDPLIVATYDPICKWPTKTQKQVDEARVKHLGACLDGEMSRVPFPPKVCELPELSQEQVDNSNDKRMIACVDGEGAKVPFPLEPCTYPQLTSEQVQAAGDKDLIVCVDGRNGKVPVPDSLFDTSLCEYPLITLNEAKAAGSNLTIGACANGREVRIPVDGSGFFDRDYICVPLTDGPPSGAPFSGTGPLRVDCNGTLWVWLCDQSKWQRVTDGIGGVPGINPGIIPDICNNLRLKGWFANNADPCVQDVIMTLKQLADLIENCLGDGQCHNPVIDSSQDNFPFKEDRSFHLNKIALANLDVPDVFDANGRYVGIYNMRQRIWEKGTVDMSGSGSNPDIGVKPSEYVPGANTKSFTITNYDRCTKFYRIVNSVQLYQRGKSYNSDFTVSVVGRASTSPTLNWHDFAFIDSKGNYDPSTNAGAAPRRRYGAVSWYSKENGNSGNWADQDHFTVRYSGSSPVATTGQLAPGESVTFYIHGFLIVSANQANLNETNLVTGFGVYADWQEIRGTKL